MFIQKLSIDDIILDLSKSILEQGEVIQSSKGENREILGVNIKLTNPRNRLSRSFTRNVFLSPLGEFLWYYKGSDLLSDIEIYIPKYRQFSNDEVSLTGAYGPRIFGPDDFTSQLRKVINLIKKKNDTRQAVIQIFDKSDLQIEGNLDIPCTLTLQFIHRKGNLHMFVNMRSNDLFVGFLHDVFCFTMIQELVANELGFELGYYHHSVSCLHIYSTDFEKAQEYVNEGYHQNNEPMPSMPKIDNFKELEKFCIFEKDLLKNPDFIIDRVELDPYWKDLFLVILLFHNKRNKIPMHEDVLNRIASDEVRKYLNLKYF